MDKLKAGDVVRILPHCTAGDGKDHPLSVAVVLRLSEQMDDVVWVQMFAPADRPFPIFDRDLDRLDPDA